MHKTAKYSFLISSRMSLIRPIRCQLYVTVGRYTLPNPISARDVITICCVVVANSSSSSSSIRRTSLVVCMCVCIYAARGGWHCADCVPCRCPPSPCVRVVVWLVGPLDGHALVRYRPTAARTRHAPQRSISRRTSTTRTLWIEAVGLRLPPWQDRVDCRSDTTD